MFGQPRGGRRRIEAIAQRFREKGATSPEKAMTAQELGLPPRFEEAMKRRLGQTGVFVDVGGRYYLNEQRLRELEQAPPGAGGMPHRGGTGLTLRIVRMLLAVAIVVLILLDFATGSDTVPWFVIAGLAVLWVCVTFVQITLLARRARSW